MSISYDLQRTVKNYSEAKGVINRERDQKPETRIQRPDCRRRGGEGRVRVVRQVRVVRTFLSTGHRIQRIDKSTNKRVNESTNKPTTMAFTKLTYARDLRRFCK